jgi:plasmid stabilization system protein ParE
MRLEWSVFAQADREAIFDYIEADSPQAAVRVDERIQAQVEQLTNFPEMGRPGRIAGTRASHQPHTVYRAYRIAARYRSDFARAARCPALAGKKCTNKSSVKHAVVIY